MQPAATTRHAVVRDWLASADPDPEHALRWWAANGQALIPAGTSWDAVHADLVTGLRVAQRVPGPVICEPEQDTVTFLIPHGSAWPPVAGVRHDTGAEVWVSVPDPDRTAAPGLHWLRPPVAGQLVDAEALHVALCEVVS